MICMILLCMFVANAWEEGDEVVLVSCRMQRTNFTIWKEYFPPTNDMELESPQLYAFFCFNLNCLFMTSSRCIWHHLCCFVSRVISKFNLTFSSCSCMCPISSEIAHIIFWYRYEFRLKLDTGQVTQKHLSTLAIEVPRINEYYIGR
jgi:carotenoid cleavage dioxygenase-like enzyme